jgi:hypothetical protein
MDWLQSVISAINLLLQEGAALSVLLGLAVSIFGTQYVKKLEAFPSETRWIRALALPLGFFPTFFTWPDHTLNAVRFFVAIAVGLSAPIVYQGVIALVRRKWPEYAEKFSAVPKPQDTLKP